MLLINLIKTLIYGSAGLLALYLNGYQYSITEIFSAYAWLFIALMSVSLAEDSLVDLFNPEDDGEK